MMIPIVSIPASIEAGLKPYRSYFSRSESFAHFQEYCTGLVVLEKPSIRRMAQCFVAGPSQSSLNKTLTRSPWSAEAVNAERLARLESRHRSGLTVGIIDSTLLHHPRSKQMYGVYKYWDYVNGCYTHALQLVTAAISTQDRLDGFDYRIYHRSFEQQEQLYLAHSGVEQDTREREPYLRRLCELLHFALHRRQAKTKPELAVELIDELEASGVAPNVYAVDNGLFAPMVIARIEHYGKPWVADSEKNRVLFYKGRRTHCEDFEASLPDEAFREVTVRIRGQERTYWAFTCTVRIRKYGKVRLAIIYDNPNRRGTPKYVFTNMLVWNLTKIVLVRAHRWDIEPFHEQIKQVLGAEDSQLRTETGIRKHLTGVFVVNSLLNDLDLTKPIGELPMEWPKDVQPTFGQRARRILLEVFYDLIKTIAQGLQDKHLSETQVFKDLFRRIIYA